MQMQIALFAAIVLVAQVLAFDPAPAPFWWLNTFLDQKIIGRYELPNGQAFVGVGPCPDYGRKCKLKLAELPQTIKDIGVALPDPFDDYITLGQALPSGELWIYKLELSEIEMKDIRASGQSVSPSKELLNLEVENFKFSARTELQLVDIPIPVLTGTTLGSIDVNISIARSRQTLGNQVDLRLSFESPAGKTLTQSLPSNITVETCGLTTELGLQLNIRSAYPFQDQLNTVTGLVTGIAEPLMGYLLCGVIKQLFTTVSGKPGLILQAVNYTNHALANISTLPDPNVDAEELKIVNSLSQEVKDNAISFRDNLAVKGASNVLNNFLGVPNGNPFVNEAVNLLSMPNNGTAVFAGLQDLGFSFSLATPPFLIDIDLINVTLHGLNSFQKFELIKNNYQLASNLRDEYTLENRLKMGTASLKLVLDLTLTDNTTTTSGWLFRRPPFTGQSTTSLRVELDAGLSGLDLILFLTIVNEPHALHNLQIGQLLGKSSNATTFIDQAAQAGKCSAPAMHAFGLPFFELSVLDLATPNIKLSPLDSGLSNLLNNSTARILNIVESAIKNNLADISQHWLRPLVNEIASGAFVHGASGADCPEYVSQGRISPNFETSRIFFSLSKAIRDVIGGDPVKQTAVSINQVIPIIMDFVIQAFELSGTNLAPGNWSFTPDFRILPGKSFIGDSASLDTFFQLSRLDIYGLDSVTKLLLTPTGPQSLTFNLELGTVSNPFELLFFNRLRADYISPALDIDESFNVRITLSGLKINVSLAMDMDLNELYLLTLDDLSYSACLFAPFLALDVDLDLSVANLAIDVSHTQNPLGANGNKLRQALQILDGEKRPSSSLKNMLNYIFTSVRSYVGSTLDEVSSAIVNSTNCVEQANAFDTVTARVTAALFQVKNFTELISKATGPQPTPLTPAQADAQVFISLGGSPLDLQESNFASIINDGVKGISQHSMVNVLQSLGNGTGDAIQDAFVTEIDGSVSLDLNITSLIPDGVSLDAFIAGGTLYPRKVRLTKLTSLEMDSLRLLEPVSKFVTKTFVKIPGTIEFEISLDLDLPLKFKNPALTGISRESVTLNVQIDDLVVDVEVLTALNKARLDGLSLASFLTLDLNGQLGVNPDIVDCVTSLFFQDGLSIPRLQIDVSSIRPVLSISPNTFVSAGTEAVISALTEIFFDFVSKDLKDFTQGGVRPFINTFVLEPYTKQRRKCTHPPIPQLPPSKQFLNFNQSEVIHLTNHILKDVLRGNDSQPYSLLNSIISSIFDEKVFLEPSDGYEGLGFSNFSLSFKKALLALISFHFTDVSLHNLGTFRTLNLLEPRTNTTFFNEIEIAGPVEAAFAIRLHIKELFQGYGPEGSKDELRFALSIHNISISTGIELELNLLDLLLVQAGSFTNFSQIACVISPLRKFAFDDFEFDLGSVSLEVTCIGTCNSPYFQGLQNGGSFTTDFNLEFIGELLGLGIKLMVDYLNSDQAEQDAQHAIDNAAFDCAVSLNLTNVVRILNPEPAHGLNVAVIFGLGWCGVIAGLLLLMPTLVVRHYQLKDKYIATNLMAANSIPGATTQSVARFMAKAERDGLALAWHPAVSTCCKVIVPIICMLNVALLTMSFVAYLNFEMSGSLYILGQQTKVVTLVPWYISNTINDMWNSGAWPLALLVVFMSCAWPVIKNVLLFMIWYSPKHFLSHHRREWLLEQMDILGKWSFLDIYVIVVFVGALRFSLVLADAPALGVFPIPEKAFVLDATVIPGTGIIMLCIAALASLIINHVIIWEMHKAEFADRRLFKVIDGVQDDMLTPKATIHLRISDYVFSTSSPDGKRDRFAPRAKNQVILMIGAVVLLLIAGFFVPYFTLTYDGLVGITIGFFIDGGRVRTLSLVSIGLKVMEASDGSVRLNLIFFFFQLTYFVTVCVAPLLHLFLHTYLWLRPLTLQQAKTVLFYAKVAAYWAALEVFALAIVATTIEVKPITHFLVDIITGNTCGAARPVLEEYLGEQGDCLLPGAYLAWGFPIIFGANMLQIAVGVIMLRANGVAIRDREEILEREPHKPWTWTEYLIVKHLMANPIEHFKPNKPMLSFMRRRDSTKSMESKQPSEEVGVKHTTSAGTNCLSCLDSCFGGVKDVSLTAPITQSKPNSRWNMPSQQVRVPSLSRSIFNQQQSSRQPSTMQQTLMPAPGNSVADNPVFRQERSRVGSVDV